jgi:glycosyltransferase involved in cell wall biosynthesis
MITNTKFRQQNKTNKAKNTLIVGIDLLWVRPNKVGGTESYIRNLLQGFKFYSPDGFFFMLFVSKDNIESFQEYIEKPNFKIIKCEIKSSNIVMRILWENIYLDKFAVKHNVDVMFIPVYSMPLKNSSIPYVVTIHDLQALHYPEYFSKLKNIWMRCSWKHTIKKANKIIAISNFVKEDIHRNLRGPLEKIQVIYNPVSVTDIYEDYGTILNQYGIQKRGYFYTISSLLPHKNTEVLIKILLNIKQEAQSEMPRKLVISGIKGTRAEFLNNLSKKLGVSENIIYTGFISNQI